jgi:DNA-binding NtrC family response regulator
MKTILVVDDEVEIVAILEQFLIKHGFNVVTAFSAENALRLIEAPGAIDLIILDIIMRGISGVKMLEELMRRDKVFEAIILRGSVDLQEYIDDLRKIGYDENDTLGKPVDLNELLDKVKEKLKPGPG